MFSAKRRKAVGSRLRFEIFKRDGFKCRYCGRPSAEEPLTIDHLVAVANGGTNDPSNLLSACATCNRGKSAVPLTESRLSGPNWPHSPPDVEAARIYAEEQVRLEKARREALNPILAAWVAGLPSAPLDESAIDRLALLLTQWGQHGLLCGIEMTAKRMAPDGLTTTKALRYLHGVLRNWEIDAQGAGRNTGWRPIGGGSWRHVSTGEVLHGGYVALVSKLRQTYPNAIPFPVPLIGP